jgi:hypothetical protein
VLPSRDMGLIAALAAGTARRIGEIGFIVGAVGGVLLVLAAARTSGRGAAASRALTMLAGVCIAIGFVLGIIALHWGL